MESSPHQGLLHRAIFLLPSLRTPSRAQSSRPPDRSRIIATDLPTICTGEGVGSEPPPGIERLDHSGARPAMEPIGVLTASFPTVEEVVVITRARLLVTTSARPRAIWEAPRGYMEAVTRVRISLLCTVSKESAPMLSPSQTTPPGQRHCPKARGPHLSKTARGLWKGRIFSNRHQARQRGTNAPRGFSNLIIAEPGRPSQGQLERGIPARGRGNDIISNISSLSAGPALALLRSSTRRGVPPGKRGAVLRFVSPTDPPSRGRGKGGPSPLLSEPLLWRPTRVSCCESARVP